MSGHVLATLALAEVRLRMRRASTMVALLAVVALSWAMIADPAGGEALLVFNKARVLYTSSALALGSATLGAVLFGLGGFYLVRGRMSEDVRSGIGGVIGTTPVGSGVFLTGRWLGCVAYLGALVAAFMLTMLVLHALRGDGPIEPLVYLQTYVLLLLPMVFFAASCAILFDSWAPLMGKGGDLLFFVLWVAQLVLMTQGASSELPALMVFDFSGLAVAVAAVQGFVSGADFSIGSSKFDPALTPVTLPSLLWSARMMALRGASSLIAILPLLPAWWLFHRYSPDRVKPGRARVRRSPLALLNAALRPLAALAAPLLGLAARLPGVAGQVLADIALTFIIAPSALPVLLLCAGAALFAPSAALPAVVMAGVAFWGILVSDMSTRDFAADTEDMTGVVGGGVARRYLRQYAASVLLGLMFMGPVALRWSPAQPVRALALVAGVACLAALASLFGRCSRSARLFLSLFLFGLYVALNATRAPMLDAVGFNGAANLHSAGMYALVGALALAGGYLWNASRPQR
ncbi:hypothetical protein CR152_13665 [Massilia violaceinigra]|uniref:Uncharacterized protein n=1 Tax=Massilia violaceinigra TaxID=2045208 RepID=A0A2D2DKE3_9BURK|nr:hypothetical protein [Massilia violaceinigra]ATQ75451.1 hypothetical protein CR152_13665 [Massilia violaceinigra]